MKSLLATLFILPFAYLLVLAAAGDWRYPLVLPESWTLDHVEQLFGSGLPGAAGLSIFISVAVALGATVAGYWTARSIAKDPRRKRLLAMAYFPYALSPVVYASCLQYYFVWSNLSGTVPGVIISQFLIVFPFAVILLVNHWDEKLMALEQLAYTLGSSSWQAMRRVLLPVSKDMLLLCFFQCFLISWFEYGLTSVIGVGKVQTLTLKVFQYIGESNASLAALSSCLLIFPPVILLWINKSILFRPSMEENP